VEIEKEIIIPIADDIATGINGVSTGLECAWIGDRLEGSVMGEEESMSDKGVISGEVAAEDVAFIVDARRAS